MILYINQQQKYLNKFYTKRLIILSDEVNSSIAESPCHCKIPTYGATVPFTPKNDQVPSYLNYANLNGMSTLLRLSFEKIRVISNTEVQERKQHCLGVAH